jgi:hypothetical protein
MGFESGNVSFRLFYLTQQYTSSIVEEFARRLAPPIETLDRDPISGWVGPRHLFDRDISDEKCVAGPFLSVQLLKAEKKIPASLLRAYQKLEEDIEMKARGVENLSRKAKAEVKARVIAMLQPKMPPTLQSIPTVLDFRNDLLIAGALNDQQIDAFVLYAKETLDSMPILLTAETAAMRRKQVNAKDLDPVMFTPDDTIDPPIEGTLGMDFMTWLWFAWEKEGGVYHLPDGREFGITLEGPVTFFREGQGAHEVALRKGLPLNSREAGTALVCGKKLKRAKVTLAHASASYSANMDSDFAFRGLKLPKGEQVEDTGKIEERMMFIEFFWSAWLHLFDTFLDLRTDPRKWQKTLANMRDWVGVLATK